MLNSTLFQVVKSIWPLLTVFATILIITRIYYLKLNGKSFTFYKEILALLFIIYLIVLYDLLVKIEMSPEGVNFIPVINSLNHISDNHNYLSFVISSAIVFLPFGYFISSYVEAKKIGSIFIITLLTGVVIEFVKLQTIGSFNIDNIITYLVGGIIGFLLYIGLSAIKKHLPGLFQNDFLYNVVAIAIIVLVALYFFGVISFGWLS